MTKFGKAITDIAYNVNDEDEEDDSNEDEDDDEEDGDAKLARKLSRQQEDAGERRSRRLAKDSGALQEAAEGTAERERKQIKLMARRNEQRLREIARENQKSKGKNSDENVVEELETYKSTKDYPSNVQPNQVKVDMASECVLLPLFGNPVPFHISTIKNVVLPDPDNATLLRINFYTAGMAVGKDAPANMAKLVPKYAPYAAFIRELTFRSLDGHNLVQVSGLWLYCRTLSFSMSYLFCFCAGVPPNLGAPKARSCSRSARDGRGDPCETREACSSEE